MHVSALFEVCWCCHAGFRAAASQPDIAVPAAAAAAAMAGASFQQSTSDAAVPMHQASASNQASDSGSDSASPQEAMDLQQALKIVSQHYVARNSSSLPLLACTVNSPQMLTCGKQHPGMQCCSESAITHHLAQYSTMEVCRVLVLLLIDA